MGIYSKLLLVIPPVLVAGIGYYLYTPVPDCITERWKYRRFHAKLKVYRLVSRLGSYAGYNAIDMTRWIYGRVIASYETGDAIKQVRVEDTTVDGVRIRIYKPKPVTKRPLPGLIYFHGGGWIYLHIEQTDSMCACLAKESNIIVISVEYSLAPEHIFPAGFDDCATVVLDVLHHGEKYGIDSNRVAIAGDSAGGNHTAAIAIKFRDDKVKPPLKAMIPIYPALQFCNFTLPIWKVFSKSNPDVEKQVGGMLGMWLGITSAQISLIGSGKFLTPELQEKTNELVDYRLLPKHLIQEGYTPHDHTATDVNEDVEILSKILTDPRIAPLMVEDLTNLPATMLVSVQWDVLRDEGLIFAKRLEMAGNKVRLLYIPDSFHGVLHFYEEFKTGMKIFNEMVLYLKTTL